MTASNVDQPESSTRRRRYIGVLVRWVGSFLVVGATLGLLAFLAWKKYGEIQAAMNMPPPPEMPVAVGTQPVGTIAWRNSTTGIGTILAPRSITVNNELPGTVVQVMFKPGQLVEEGVELLSLDTSVEQAQLKAAMAREKFALATLERNQQLAESIPEKDVEEVESRWHQAQAEVEELKAMIARKTIISPFRGRVGLSDIQPGQYLPAGSLITTLQSVEDHLLVEFTLAQYIVSQVQTGDSISVVFTGASYPAEISAIDAQADRQTRNVRVRAQVDHPPASMSPGDSVSVKVEFGPDMKLLSVPAESVRRSPQGTFVFLAEKNKAGELRASARPVVLATTVGSSIGIASGISADEQVIVEGAFKLQDGMLVAAINAESDQKSGHEKAVNSDLEEPREADQ